jgi:pilus assembly protein CpaB
MGRARIFIVLAIAAVGALSLALIVGMMTKHKTQPPQSLAVLAPQQAMARVLVARHDLAVGTRLSAGDMSWQDWPASAVNAAFITDGAGAHAPPISVASQANQTIRAAATVITGGDGPMQQLSGSIVRSEILANEPIENSKLVRGGEGGYMAVVLRPGMRAVSVSVQPNSAAGGFILPGDRVDVVQAHPADAASNGGRAGFVAEVLVRNVRVLAIDQTSQAPKNGQQSQVGAVATLEVAAADVGLIAKAKMQGDGVILALRPYSDANQPSGRADDSQDGQVRIFRAGQPPEVMALK